MFSLRRRLMLVLSIGFAGLVAVAGTYLDDELAKLVTAEFDAATLATAQALVALVEEEDGEVEFDYSEKAMPQFQRAEEPDYFQFWLAGGNEVLLRSKRLGEDDLALDPAPSGGPVVHDMELPGGRAGRGVQLTFAPNMSDEDLEKGKEPLGVKLTLVVARGRERLDALLATIRVTILAVGGIAVLLAGTLVWQAVRAGFRPIQAIAAQVERLDADNLDERVRGPKVPKELAPIVDQLNALLDRLQASFERERRFTGNVAHELRTPIAELRSLAEVARKWPEDTDAVVRYFEDVEDIAGRMDRVVHDLLLLARCHAGVESTEKQPTSLKRIVEVTWSKLERKDPDKALRFTLELPEELVVESDPGKLAIILANLLENAVSYAPAGAEIRCSGASDGSTFRLEIANPADPMTREELGKLAEPFWRKDAARAAPDHAGLGLSLVTALAGLLGLGFDLGQEADGTFRARLRGRLRRSA